MIKDAAPRHVDSVRSHFIDLLSEAQIATLGDVAETDLAHLGEVAASSGRLTEDQKTRLPKLRDSLRLDPPP